LPAAALQVGDEIRNADWATGTVEAIEFVAKPQTMYNFTVATAHTYFVGEGRWLVHNSCGNKAIFDQLTDGQNLLTDDVLKRGQEFVGDNALQISEGNFISSIPVDGTDIYARFRITDGDITGAHGGGPHANFELVRQVIDPSTGRASYLSIPGQNKHIYFSDIP
jgi:hypothetical protein